MLWNARTEKLLISKPHTNMNMIPTWIRKIEVEKSLPPCFAFLPRLKQGFPKLDHQEDHPKTSSQTQRTSHTQERKEKWEGMPRRGLEAQDDNSTLVAWNGMRCEHRGCLYRVSRGVDWHVCAKNLPIFQNFVPPNLWNLVSKLGFGNHIF